MNGPARERGQGSVELVAIVTVLLAVALGAAQLLAASYADVLTGNAAEAVALAVAGGGDPEAAARAALPGWSRKRLEVAVRGGEVRVRLRPPALIPRLGGELEVTAHAAVEAP